MTTINVERRDDGSIHIEMLDGEKSAFMTFANDDAALRFAARIALTCGKDALFIVPPDTERANQ